MLGEQSVDADLTWVLLYTKPRAEVWAEANLRKQGFGTLFPRVAARRGFTALFPRYVFAGYSGSTLPAALRSTFGVQYVVRLGERPAQVPFDILAEIRSRMNETGVVELAGSDRVNPLFASRERERVAALLRLAEAGFRVKLA